MTFEKKTQNFIAFTWSAVMSDLSFDTAVHISSIAKHGLGSLRTFLK